MWGEVAGGFALLGAVGGAPGPIPSDRLAPISLYEGSVLPSFR